MRTITIEVPDGTRYMDFIVFVGSDNDSEPIFVNFDPNTISGAKINENGEVAYMIRLEKKGGVE